MKFTATIIEEIFTSYLEKIELAWWVEIITLQPQCTYYFGPFISQKEAEIARAGYVEDLEQEGVKRMIVQIKQGQPRELTLFEDELAPISSANRN